MAYVWHRAPCCKAIREQKHQKNQQEQEESIPNNIIKYTASEKLVETNNVPNYSDGSTGLRITQFNTTIVDHTFENGVGTIIFEEDVTEIKKWAFYNNNITSITIPNSITSIGDSSFSACSNLISIIIPDSVTSIGNSAFYHCSELTSVIIGNNVTSIGGMAFSYCTNLTLVTIPDSITNIVSGVFEGCSSLTSIIIPSSVTNIESNAFQDCSNLNSITSLASIAPTIQYNTFRNIKNNGILYVPINNSGYNDWMKFATYYLGYYHWTKVEQ